MNEHSWAATAKMIDENAEKATLFDVLAARIKSHDWHVVPSSGRDEVVIYDHSRGERVHGATLAEVVTKAMESEER